MRLLVTGGAGFIGSTYVRHVLATTDDQVTVLEALTYAGNRENLADVEQDPRFAFVHGDICDRSVVDAALPGHDAVVHFAAESHVDRSLLDPDVFVRTNCDGTNVMCDLAARHGVERFVHVYRRGVRLDRRRVLRRDRPVVAAIPLLGGQGGLRPDRPGAPRDARPARRRDPLVEPVRALPVPKKLIPLFVTNLLDGHNVPLYGDGANIRDWLFVRDNCEAVDLVLRQGVVGEIYNIGGGNELTNREVTAAVLGLLDCPESRIDHVEDRLGHDRRYSISSEKVAALGWSPGTAFADGLEDAFAFYRDRHEWWEPLLARVRKPVRS